jgi:protein-tyrosine-phosphatase
MRMVLFLGVANSTRTQMAEAILRHYGGDEFTVHSAGLRPTAGVWPFHSESGVGDG